MGRSGGRVMVKVGEQEPNGWLQVIETSRRNRNPADFFAGSRDGRQLRGRGTLQRWEGYPAEVSVVVSLHNPSIPSG